MAFETSVKSIDKLKQALQNRINSEIYIDTSIKKGTPDFIGFPMHYNYIPVVFVRAKGMEDFLLEGLSQESPDEELLRCRTRVNALELGFTVVGQISSIVKQENESVLRERIKVNDLPLAEAQKQLESYKAELARIEDAHKNWGYR